MALALLLPPSASAEPLPVVASFSLLADMTRQIGGPEVTVTSLAGPNTDPHTVEPTPADARRLTGASLLIVNGLGFDRWADRLADAAGFRGQRLVASTGITSVEDNGAIDPHAWTAPSNAIAYVHQIAGALSALQPQKRALFEANAAAYAVRLEALDQRLRAAIMSVPPERRCAITAHRAFDYFGRAYGIEMLAPVGPNAEAEPSGRQVARLVELLRSGRPCPVFTEHLEDARLIRRIAAEASRPVVGELYADSLSGPDGPAPSFETLLRYDGDLIIDALGGRAPGPVRP